MLSGWHVHAKQYANELKERADVKITALWDEDTTRGTEWAKELEADFETDLATLLKREDVDAVAICSPTDMHKEIMLAAAKAGKHIFCEKPIDFDLDKINKALSEVEKAGVKFQVGFVRRFDHNHKKVRDIVASGVLGRPHIVKVTSRDPEFPAHRLCKGFRRSLYGYDDSRL